MKYWKIYSGNLVERYHMSKIPYSDKGDTNWRIDLYSKYLTSGGPPPAKKTKTNTNDKNWTKKWKDPFIKVDEWTFIVN